MYIYIPILLLFLLPFTQSQNNNPLCVSLKNSTICSAFQSYSINILEHTNSWLQNSTTIENIDTTIQQYINSTPWWQIINSNLKGCSSYNNNNNIRYLQTIVCTHLVTSSFKTCHKQLLQQQEPLLCNNTCQQFIQTLPHNDTCLDNQMNVYNQLCHKNNINNQHNCINGYTNQDYCGWMTRDQSCQYCSNNPNDTCCINIQPCNSPPQHNNDNDNSNSNNNNASVSSIIEQPSENKYSNGQIAAIIIGSILATCFLCLFGFCCFYNMRKKKISPPIISSFYWRRKKNIRESFYSGENDQLLFDDDNPAKHDDQNRKLHFSRTSEISTANHYTINSQFTTNHHHVNHNNSDNDNIRYTLTDHYNTNDRQDPTFYQAVYVNLPRDDLDLLIHKNDLIYLFCYTNDDWGIGYNLNTGNKGLFPLICIRSITINEVWDIIDHLPSKDECHLLKFRASYFLSEYNKEKNDQNEIEEQNDQEERDISTIKKDHQQEQHHEINNITHHHHRLTSFSSDDDLSPITPPATTFHRSNFIGNPSSTFSSPSSSTFSPFGRTSTKWPSNPFSKTLNNNQQQSYYYLPLDSFTTLNEHESSTTTTT
ncbi:unnamed protein product [Cunninghamella blakesleeana]